MKKGIFLFGSIFISLVIIISGCIYNGNPPSPLTKYSLENCNKTRDYANNFPVPSEKQQHLNCVEQAITPCKKDSDCMLVSFWPGLDNIDLICSNTDQETLLDYEFGCGNFCIGTRSNPYNKIGHYCRCIDNKCTREFEMQKACKELCDIAEEKTCLYLRENIDLGKRLSDFNCSVYPQYADCCSHYQYGKNYTRSEAIEICKKEGKKLCKEGKMTISALWKLFSAIFVVNETGEANILSCEELTGITRGQDCPREWF